MVLFRPEEAVAGVAQAGQDVAVVVELSSMAAVKIGTSGWASCKARDALGAASRQTNLIDFGRVSLRRSTAATAELPVASIGSTTIDVAVAHVAAAS